MLGIPQDRVIETHTEFCLEKFDKPQLFADGCHPNDEGYKVLAELVHEALDLKPAKDSDAAKLNE